MKLSRLGQVYFGFWPTWMWLMGLIGFFIRIKFEKVFSDILLVGFVFLSVLGSFFFRHNLFRVFSRSSKLLNYLIIIVSLLLGASLFEALHAPYLTQEYDALNYHMAIPRQHLIHKSTQYIPWAVAELFPMMIQWGLSSFWFMTEHIHKIPQWIFSFFIFIHLIWIGFFYKDHSKWDPFLIALGVFSTHGIVIQLGLATMDLVNLYFLLATALAVLLGFPVLAAIHLAVFASAKAFSMYQVFGLLLFLSTGFLLKSTEDLKKVFGQFSLRNLVLSAVVFGVSVVALNLRSWIISFERAGTPSFPFWVCKVWPASHGCMEPLGQYIAQSAKMHLESKDFYGLGRGIWPFIMHFWKVSVPTTNVNNEYDYPLGLSWLISCVFLYFGFVRIFKKKTISLWFFAALYFWVTWWFGSQQSRWLYPVIIFSWIYGYKYLSHKIDQNSLVICLIIGGSFSLLSQVRGFVPVWKLGFSHRVPVYLKGQAAPKETLFWNWPLEQNPSNDLMWVLPLSGFDKNENSH